MQQILKNLLQNGLFYVINAIKNLRKPCRKIMLFEEYFVKFKGIKSLKAYFRFFAISEDIFRLIVVYKIFYTNRNYMT